MTQLSKTVKELIAKARIVSFAEWEQSHPQAAMSDDKPLRVYAIFQAADDAFRYLSNEDFLQIKTLSPDNSELIPVAQLLRDRAAEIVDESREEVLANYPEIIQPGGGLYPAERAQACWRDFWHFLRCITYGIAGGHAEYTNPTGLHYMNLLYQELQVPLDAMVLGLKSIKAASLKRCQANQQQIAPYFDHLISQLATFQIR
ncbi:phycobilisome protein [Nostoc sp. 'Peltigera membranacea cyanobiont' 210A]|uniref:phycobilisome protein n=1 Tax=Nostoc sp. 'Peltigera membranacea cyanobiont' 210A TaxID=2014529 RepID=UPI000B9564F7|nr:phycobilisome protein [Nostoc sp. 'Peltigera membranacea cyanobiont' 210A]OYD95831.1 phycobilisome protein [Nostoc sp. 'Peltigera membranacea cyanobiont' 210A]